MAFFLAIAPWPYAELYPQLERYVATTDYRRYNLVEPVIKPTNMTVEELGRELGMAAQKFYLHKFQNLDRLTPWKREFMLAVFDILVNNSYLAGQMRTMMREGKEMPPEVKALIQNAMGQTGEPSRGIAPIP
jgi:anaerobic magnesium-protoporphyrin IX monomethyl ester cyclase